MIESANYVAVLKSIIRACVIRNVYERLGHYVARKLSRQLFAQRLEVCSSLRQLFFLGTHRFLHRN